ncbi:unnamed protein product [Diabrotica balteata]|uniref:Saposin B-type domain-containing protein n=1 Tax=Diabrotica balteata TaxID=107213 RepID=A0A9N9T7G5_DIABA|nr:unnamed protein product [Diabrotica balteata]
MKTTLFLAVLACVGLTVYGQKNDFFCDTCVSFATAIQNFVKEEIPLDQVEKDAQALCDLLPGDLKTFCEKDLLPEVEKIYNAVSSTSPQEICQDLELC